MQQSGEYRIGASRQALWDALNDPDVLARCIDGCEELVRVGDDAFRAKVKARIGLLSATFDGEVKLADLDPPTSYRLEVSAKAGPAGFGKGTAKVTLADEGTETLLHYLVDGSIGGKLAQVGQRLVDAAARKMADDFFAHLSEIVAPVAGDAPAPTPKAEPADPAAPKAPFGVYAAAVVAAIALAAVLVLMIKR